MKNEWGAELDRNGYAPSIVQADTSKCFLCQRSGVKLDRHEIFGNAMRSKSKRMGLWVSLCHTPCHLTHAHGCAEVMDWLRYGCRCWWLRYGCRCWWLRYGCRCWWQR
jgi:hypothetical protein